jgi:hypothetical protein
VQRAAFAQPVVQGIGVLYGLVAEKLERIVKHRHSARLTSVNAEVNGMATGRYSAIDPVRESPSHGGRGTSQDG